MDVQVPGLHVATYTFCGYVLQFIIHFNTSGFSLVGRFSE